LPERRQMASQPLGMRFPQCPNANCLKLWSTEDADGTRELGTGASPKVVRKSDVRLLQLACARFPKELQIDFVDHPDAAGADRVPEALEPAVSVYRQTTCKIKRPGLLCVTVPSPVAEVQVFTDYDLGYAPPEDS